MHNTLPDNSGYIVLIIMGGPFLVLLIAASMFADYRKERTPKVLIAALGTTVGSALMLIGAALALLDSERNLEPSGLMTLAIAIGANGAILFFGSIWNSVSDLSTKQGLLALCLIIVTELLIFLDGGSWYLFPFRLASVLGILIIVIRSRVSVQECAETK